MGRSFKLFLWGRVCEYMRVAPKSNVVDEIYRLLRQKYSSRKLRDSGNNRISNGVGQVHEIMMMRYGNG